jgi:hypothetical protein
MAITSEPLFKRPVFSHSSWDDKDDRDTFDAPKAKLDICSLSVD